MLIDYEPLRERRTDILLLAEFFLAKYCRENRKKINRISTPAIDLLMQYHWPGNVRELENCIERAVLICSEEAIKSFHLPPTLQVAEPAAGGRTATGDFAQAVENFERELIIAALKRCRGNQTKAAKDLGTSLRIINYKITKCQIDCSLTSAPAGREHPPPHLLRPLHRLSPAGSAGGGAQGARLVL